MRATGFVTAGGRSSRMGRDKAWLNLGGRPMIERVIAAIKPVTSAIHIIANREDYMQFGFPVFADENEGIGPLEAIRLALTKSWTRLVIVVGCDLPFLRAELFEYLLAAIDKNYAAIPISADGKFEPLAAVYSTEALNEVTELIAGGKYKVSRLFERLPTRFVPFAEIKNLSGSSLFFENVNTPEQYEAALKRLAVQP
jgi:molybdopterin-guanine dinucleotide biosynthesis protein A